MESGGHNWQALFKESASLIGTVATSTESVFLAIGSKLMDIHNRSSHISTLAGQTAAAMSGEKMTQATDLLAGLVDQMKGYLQTTDTHRRKDLESLETVRGQIEAARKIFLNFAQMSKALHNLATMTRIESARLIKGDQSFIFLAEEVARQSKTIGAKSSDALDKLEHLRSQVAEIESRLTAMDSQSGNRGQSIIDHIVSGLTGLQDKTSAASHAATGIAERAQAIYQRLSQVVSALQFHDITRQKLEHVQKALADKLQDRNPSGAELLSQLQVAQLRQANTDFHGAVESLIGDLMAVAAHIKETVNETVEVADAAGQGGLSFQTRLKKDMSTAATLLDSHGKLSRELAQAMTSEAGALEVMSTFLNDVSEIGQSIRYIALNATIKSSHLGEEGAALETLAQAIRDISKEAQSMTVSATRALTAITESAHHLREGRDKEMDVNQTLAAFNQVLTSVREASDAFINQVEKIKRDGHGLAEEISRLATGVNVHHTVDRQLKQALMLLDRIGGTTLTPGMESVARDQRKAVDQLTGQYTMDSEREIHQAVLAGKKPIVGSPAKDKKKASDGKAEEDLGDNVELF